MEQLAQKYTGKERPAKPNPYEHTYTDKDGNIVENKPGSPLWYQQQCEWLWWMYANGYTDINYNMRMEMITNRLYAEGRQPVQKYLARWFRYNKKTNRMTTFANISFDINPVLPKFLNYVRGLMDKIDFNIDVTAQNAESIMQREMIVGREMAQTADPDFYGMAHGLIGEEMPESELPFTPENADQMQMLEDMGFIKLPDEVRMENKLSTVASLSNWSEIKAKVEYDLFVQGVAATKIDRDPVTKQQITRYSNIENLIAIYRNRDVYYRDVSYVAEIVPYRISDLKAAGFNDEALRKAINNCQGLFGNPMVNMTNYPTTFFSPNWMDMLVYVMDCEFESFDFKRYKWDNFEGEDYPEYVPSDETPNNGASEKQPMTTYPKWHRCKWVIGMGVDGVFDNGFQFDVPYSQNNRPQSTFSIVRANDRSPVNIAIADADEVQNLVLARRMAVAKLRPPGGLTDKNSFADMEIGGKKFSILDHLDMFNQTGDALISNPRTPTGQAIPGVPPAHIDSKGNVDSLAYYDAAINTAIQRIAEKIGVSNPLEGSTPDPRTPVRTTQLALEGSNNILRPLIMAYREIKKQTFDKLAAKFEIMEKAELLEQGVDSIEKLMEFIDSRKYQIKADSLINDDVKQDILTKADLSLQAAKTGGVGIEYSDYFVVQNLVRRGLLKSAQWYLSWKESERKDHAIQMQRENMEMNGKNMLAQEEASRETLLQQQQMKTESTIAIDTNKILTELKKDLELGMQKGFMEMQNTILEGKIDEKLKVIQGQIDEKLEKIKPKPKTTKK